MVFYWNLAENSILNAVDDETLNFLNNFYLKY